MKSFILICIIFLSSLSSFAQSFDDALKIFRDGEYEQAVLAFARLGDQESMLMAGKSAVKLNDIASALSYFEAAQNGSIPSIRDEARYSSAILNVHSREFVTAIVLLDKLIYGSSDPSIRNRSRSIFDQVNRFLSGSERRRSLIQPISTQSKEAILTHALRSNDLQVANAYLDITDSLLSNQFDKATLNRIETIATSRPSMLPESSSPEAPQGLDYSIGVYLPRFENDPSMKIISQSLYNGILVGADKHNQQHPENRLLLSFYDADQLEASFHSMNLVEAPDMIIGPLTSTTAKRVAPLAAEYDVPLLAPLANNDSVTVDNPYIFQVNTPFKIRGELMAEFAVNVLGLDTLAVLSDATTMGAISGLSFKRRAEELGAHIAYYFNENFEKYGYDVQPFTQQFDTDPVMIDSMGYIPVKGIYMPFTGNRSQNLIDLVTTDLEALRSKAAILGSQDWGYTDLPPERLRYFTIYYPDVDEVEENSNANIDFRQVYTDRTGGLEANTFSMLGYDMAQFISLTLRKYPNPNDLRKALLKSPAFKGLSTTISFKGTQQNRALKIYGVKGENRRLIQEY